MSTPRDDQQPPPQWQDPRAGGPPPGGPNPGYPPPPPGYGPPPAGPPPSGYPPPPPATPTGGSGRDSGGLIAGVIIIGIGLFFLLGQVVPDIGRWIPLFIGLAFLAAFVAKGEYGFLVPGCIVSGVGVGVVLAGMVDDPWSGAVVLLSIAGGFIAIWVVSVLLRARNKEWPTGPSHEAAQALWWPLIPGGILTLVAIIVLAEEGFESDLLRWWPLLLIGVGLVILVSSRSRRGRG